MAFLLIGSALAAGVGVWYTQTQAYYRPVEVAANANPVVLMPLIGETPEALLVDAFEAVETVSSPLGYRACFSTSESLSLLTESYMIHDTPEPLVAPGWFDCFDAEQIAEELSGGTAVAFLGQKNIAYGVDRIVAVFGDGRGFAWHQLNDCGEKSYDGSPVGEACPDRASFQSERTE